MSCLVLAVESSGMSIFARKIRPLFPLFGWACLLLAHSHTDRSLTRASKPNGRTRRFDQIILKAVGKFRLHRVYYRQLVADITLAAANGEGMARAADENNRIKLLVQKIIKKKYGEGPSLVRVEEVRVSVNSCSRQAAVFVFYLSGLSEHVHDVQ